MARTERGYATFDRRRSRRTGRCCHRVLLMSSGMRMEPFIMLLRAKGSQGSGSSSRSLCCLIPSQELAERRAALAVLSFFFGSQFSECFLDLRKIEQGIVAESVFPPTAVQDNAFRLAAKDR